MKVTSAKIRLTNEDILEAIEEFVEVEGLSIEAINIDEFITVKGSYKKGVDIPFKAVVGIGSLKSNVVNVKIFEFKISKLGIISPIKNFALKTVLKGFEDNGLKVDGDLIAVDLNIISKFVPYINFEAKAVELLPNAIEVEVSNITYAPNKEKKEFKAKKEEKKNLNSVADKYSKLRENLQDKFPEKYKEIVEYALLIPDIAALLWRLFKDKRVELKTKMLVGGIIAYIASPIDVLPDFIPIIGKIDDVAIVFFAMNKIINDVPESIILDNWNGKDDIIKIVRDGVAFISKMVGSQNVGKLIEYVKKLSNKVKNEEKQDEERHNIH